MVIKTLEATYSVQRQLPYAQDNRVFVCEKEGVNDLFLLVEIADKETIRTAVDFLSSAKRMPEFSDFIDCFFAEENFYAVFAFYNSKSLEEILKEDHPTLPERLAMVREILEKWMLQKLPPYFSYDTARVDYIRFTAGTKSVLAFALSNLAQRDEITFEKVQQRFSKLWEAAFAEEFAKKSVPELERFKETLDKGVYEDVPALFVAYDKLEEEILKQPEGEWEASKTWPFRLWEKIKAGFPAVKRIIEFILLFAAFMFQIK
ncbi:MAG: hypothetical protein IJT32_00555 [Lachnospiraceae bacterium]|nr:hypothetical protein [Lachnospiraceae bacterium]